MSDLQKYIDKRKNKDTEFSKGFDSGYEEFKIGETFKQTRKELGLTQEYIAQKLGTKKSSISRIENHAVDIKLSTLQNFARAMGKEIKVEIV
ncbi:transcriptional regulator, XRE family [uncultured Candidatus Thioglobus sp.]|nr:transcriptional regulator, XRE family [uncultured Candidatus Thioglobus sp.]